MNSMRESDGYTLVELLGAMLITVTLGALLIALYLAAYRWVGPWQREAALVNTVHLIVHRLAADLAYAEQLIPEAGGSWTLTYPSGRTVYYSYRDSILIRNGRRMHEASVWALHVDLVPSRPETSYALTRRVRTGASRDDRVEMKIHLVFQESDRRRALTTAVALRRNRPWHPLPLKRPPNGSAPPSLIDPGHP